MTKTTVPEDKSGTEEVTTAIDDLKLEEGQGVEGQGDQASVSSKTDEEAKPVEKSSESTPPKSKKKKKKKGKKKTKDPEEEKVSCIVCRASSNLNCSKMWIYCTALCLMSHYSSVWWRTQEFPRIPCVMH